MTLYVLAMTLLVYKVLEQVLSTRPTGRNVAGSESSGRDDP